MSAQTLPHSFASALRQIYSLVAHRQPTKFETDVAGALWGAYMLAKGAPKGASMRAVTGATGSGKTQAALALLLAVDSGAIIINEIAECQRAFETLDALMPGRVVVWTSLHRSSTGRADIARYENDHPGVRITRQFTEAELHKAPVVITTHKQWRNEIESDRDLSIRNHRGAPRDVVLVDENPELEVMHVTRPQDIARLADVLSDRSLSGEARAYGFKSAETDARTLPAATALRRIADRMAATYDRKDIPALYSEGDLMGPEDIAAIAALSYEDDIRPRVTYVDEAADLWNVVLFLRAASEGRVFFSKDSDSAFYAYSLAVGPQPRTVILDGTADLSTMYAVGGAVIPVSTRKPDYRNVSIHHATLPAGLSLKRERIARRSNAAPVVNALRDYIMAVTKSRQRVLVYAKLDLLRHELHKDCDESDSQDMNYCEWEGRCIWWVNFGAGRGTNVFKNCDVYVQLDDWHPKKAVIVAKLGSALGRPFSDAELRKLSSGRTTERMYLQATESHLITHAKQNAARTAIRNLDDDGIAAPAALHFVGCKLETLFKHREAMFPGSPGITLLDHLGRPRKGRSKRATGVTAFAEQLATTDETLLDRAAVARTGVDPDNINRDLTHPKVAPIVAARGWRKERRKVVGLAGKGWVLVRENPVGL